METSEASEAAIKETIDRELRLLRQHQTHGPGPLASGLARVDRDLCLSRHRHHGHDCDALQRPDLQRGQLIPLWRHHRQGIDRSIANGSVIGEAGGV